MRNKFAREARDQRLIDLYAAGTRIVDLAKEFNLSQQAVISAIQRHPKDLEKAARRIKAIQTAVYRRGAAILSNKILLRAESMADEEAKKMRANDAGRWAEVVEKFEKQANLAEGLATERTETAQSVNIIVKSEDTARAIANGIAGGAIQL